MWDSDFGWLSTPLVDVVVPQHHCCSGDRLEGGGGVFKAGVWGDFSVYCSNTTAGLKHFLNLLLISMLV